MRSPPPQPAASRRLIAVAVAADVLRDTLLERLEVLVELVGVQRLLGLRRARQPRIRVARTAGILLLRRRPDGSTRMSASMPAGQPTSVRS
jgi:hypothetical protein